MNKALDEIFLIYKHTRQKFLITDEETKTTLQHTFHCFPNINDNCYVFGYYDVNNTEKIFTDFSEDDTQLGISILSKNVKCIRNNNEDEDKKDFLLLLKEYGGIKKDAFILFNTFIFQNPDSLFNRVHNCSRITLLANDNTSIYKNKDGSVSIQITCINLIYNCYIKGTEDPNNEYQIEEVVFNNNNAPVRINQFTI